MEVKIQNQTIKLKGPFLKVGQESPSFRVQLADGSSDVLGSIQITTQLILTIPSLDLDPFPEYLEEIDEWVSGMDKLSATVVTGDSADYIASLHEGKIFNNLNVVLDASEMAATRLKLRIPDGPWMGRPAPAIILMDVEGNLAEYRILTSLEEKINKEEFVELLNKCRAKKVREHSHNW